MVGIAVLKDVGDPLAEEFLDELDLAHAGKIVHGSEDVLDLTEADLTVALLCPVQRTGNEGLIEYLERQVVIYIRLEVLIRMLDLHVGRILLRKGDHLGKAFRKCFCIHEAGHECLKLFLHGDVFLIVRIYAVRRKTCEVIDLDFRAGSCCKRSRQCEEARSLTGVCVGQYGSKLRLLECACAYEIRITCAELIREYDLVAFVYHKGIKADISLRPLRVRVKGDRTDLVIVAVENFGLGNDGGEDNVFSQRMYFLGSEHTSIYDTKITGLALIFDLDQLSFRCHRKTFFLREDKDRSANGQAIS